MSEPGHLGIKRAESARLRRAEQLKRWKGSLTELEPVTPARNRHRARGRVRFEDGAVFLAACSSGDTEEVKRLLARGARLNTANVDGLTALHQVTQGGAPARNTSTPQICRGWGGRERGCMQVVAFLPSSSSLESPGIYPSRAMDERSLPSPLLVLGMPFGRVASKSCTAGA